MAEYYQNEEPEGKDRRFALFVEDQRSWRWRELAAGGKMMITPRFLVYILLDFCGNPRNYYSEATVTFFGHHQSQAVKELKQYF
jgi:hypothetical protein